MGKLRVDLTCSWNSQEYYRLHRVPGFRLQTLELVETTFFFPFTESINHISKKILDENRITQKQKF